MTASTPTRTADATDLFTTADRCDVCDAQAWVRAIMSTGELLFCAHHARAYPGALEKAERVEDARAGLFL